MADRIAEESSHNIVGWFKLSNAPPVVGNEKGRRGHTLTLSNNMVIMSMGECRPKQASTQLFCLDLHTWEWTKLASTLNTETMRAHHTFYLSKGMLWSFFGSGSSAVSVLDVKERTYREVKSENEPSNIFGHCGGLVNGKDVVVFGGVPSWSRSAAVTADLHVFDTKTNKWKKPNISTKCPEARYFHTMSSMKNPNRLILFGGRKKEKEVFGDIWVLNTESWIWLSCSVSGDTRPLGRAGHSLTQIGDYKWLLYGGWDGSVDPDTNEEVGALNDAWVLHQTGETSFSWRELNLQYKPMPTDCHRAVYLHHLDAVLIHGGADPSFNILNDTYVIMGEGLWTVPSLSTLAVDCLISDMTNTMRSEEDQKSFLVDLSNKLPSNSLAIILERLSFLKAMGHLKTLDEVKKEEKEEALREGEWIEAENQIQDQNQEEVNNAYLARMFAFIQRALDDGDMDQLNFEAFENFAAQDEEEEEEAENEEGNEENFEVGFVNEHPVEARKLTILAGENQVGALLNALDFVKEILSG